MVETAIHSLHTVGDFPALFEVVEGEPILEAMSMRERRILVGAANFHALCAPGRTLDLHLYDCGADVTPRTTDDRTFDGLSRIFRNRTGVLRISSKVSAGPHTVTAAAAELVARDSRHVYVSPDSVLDRPPRRWRPTDPVRRVLRAFRNRAPLAYDWARDVELLRFARQLKTAAERRDYDAEFRPGGAHSGSRVQPAPPAADGAVPAVLIGVHWFELGGAERWALETVRIVRDAGLLPIVISNVDSQHPFITRTELEGALVIPFSEPTHATQEPGTERFLAALLHEFDVRGVLVHHNQWLYDRLPWIKASRPDIPVLDSTHIVEYRGGGYPMSAVRVDQYVDLHHVISPALRSWFVDVQQVPDDKVVMAPLGGLTAQSGAERCRERRADGKLTVVFVGRMSRQKSPEMFTTMAAKLASEGVKARFIMHGDGELDDWVDDLVGGLPRGIVFERRTSKRPVAETLAEADLLVITSHNEGLTLTTLEAVAYGVPVISTNVGAQSDVVPAAALFSRHPYRGTKQAARMIRELCRDEDRRQALWEDENRMVAGLLANASATEWLTEVVSKW